MQNNAAPTYFLYAWKINYYLLLLILLEDYISLYNLFHKSLYSEQ